MTSQLRMRTSTRLMTACLTIIVFVKVLHGKPLCGDGQYPHWIAEKKDFVCCREVTVLRGYEAVQCVEEGTDDCVQICPDGTYQPDETLSSNSPHCMANPTCTDLGIKNECIEGYCWPVCICNLEHGKCGLDPFLCTDIETIKCAGRVLEDCTCAPIVTASTLLTSPPSIIKNTTVSLTQNSLVTSRSNPSTGSNNTVTTDRNEDKTDGSEKGEQWTWKIVVIVVAAIVAIGVITTIALCVYYRHKSISLKKVSAEETSLISKNDLDPVLNELGIQERSAQMSGTKKLTPPPPGPGFRGRLPKPLFPGSQQAHSEEADPSRNHMSDRSEEIDPSTNRMSHGSEEADPSRNHMSHGSKEADPSRNHMSHGSEAEPSRNNMIGALDGLNTETSLQRVPLICTVVPMKRTEQNNQSFVVRQEQSNQSSSVSQVETNQSAFGSLGPSLRIVSLLPDDSNEVEEASNTPTMEEIRELPSGDATPQSEVNTRSQFQLCSKAAVDQVDQTDDPENTDVKVISDNESSEMNAEVVVSEDTMLMKTFMEFSADF